MSEKMEKKAGRGRKVAAGALLGLGVLGIGMAAASQLGMTWSGNFQAGAVEVDADCQAGIISVGYDDPAFKDATAPTPWEIANVNFTGISEACDTKSYEAAYKTDGDWVQLDAGNVAGASLAVALPANVLPQDITEFALTIFD